MPEPIQQPAQEQAPLGTASWDSLIDTVIDEASGEIQIVVPDPEPPAAADPEAPAPEGIGPAPLDQSYEHVRAWATRASQRNSELASEVEALKQKQIDADAALDADTFVERVANALPEDMSVVSGDRRNFAKVITATAREIAKAQTKELTTRLEQATQQLAGMGQVVQLATAISPEWPELRPLIKDAANAYASANAGASIFEHFTLNDIVTAARAYRDQSRQQQQTAPRAATTAQGQAPPPPSAAPSPVREARQPSKAALAAGETGVSVHDRDLRDLGRERAKGPKGFNVNISSIIDDVLSNPVTG